MLQLYIKHSSMDQGIYRDMSSTKSRQKWICRGAIKDLLTAKSPWWIENLLRSYWADRELKNLARWIEEAVKNLSRRNPEISMDWESVKIYREKRKKGSIEMESIEDLSRSCQTWRKGVLSRREKHIEMNATSKLLKQKSNQHVKLAKHLSTYMQSIHRSKTSLTNFIFQKQVETV